MIYLRSISFFLILSFTILGISYSSVDGNTSYLKSNLDAYGRYYDQLNLILGMTQKSVSKTMEDFIEKIEEPPTAFYHRLVGSEYVYVTVEDAEEDLGFSLFDLKLGECESNSDRVAEAYAKGYDYAFSGQYGVPEVNDPSDIPAPIVFNQPGTVVTYKMVMKTFDLVAIDYEYDVREVCVTRISQSAYISEAPENEPFVFQYKVNLDLSRFDMDEETKGEFPPETQEAIDAVGIGIFSIAQLFLNLNTAELFQGLPEIPNLDPNSQLSLRLITYLRIYLDNMDPDGNGVLFGLTIEAKEPPNYDPLIIPTDLNFYINPFLNDDLSESDNYDLYTLNYWMTSEYFSLPYPSRLNWNWIDESGKDKYDGVITARRGLLAMKLAGLLSNELSEKLCYDVETLIAECSSSHVDFITNIWPCMPPRGYNYETDGKDGLTLDFDRKTEDGWVCNNSPFYAHNNIEIDTTSRVYLQQEHIYIVSENKVYFELSCDINSKGTHGTIAHYLSKAYYDLSVVDNTGVIKATLRGGKVDTEDLSEDLEIVPGDCNRQSVEDTVAYVIRSIDKIKDLMDSYAASLEDILNSQTGMVFPGAETFEITDATFSNFGDLMSHVVYR